MAKLRGKHFKKNSVTKKDFNFYIKIVFGYFGVYLCFSLFSQILKLATVALLGRKKSNEIIFIRLPIKSTTVIMRQGLSYTSLSADINYVSYN